MAKYPGKYCENLKISVSSIAKGHLHAVSADEITNGLVIELLRLRYRLRQQKLETCNWLQQLYGRKWSKLMLNQISMLKKLKILQSDHRKFVLSKNHQRLQAFLDAPFRLPVPKKEDTLRRVKAARPQKLHNDEVQHVVEALSKQLLCDNGLLNGNVSGLKKNITKLSTTNLRKRENRKQAKIIKQHQLITSLKEENALLKKENKYFQLQQGNLIKQREALQRKLTCTKVAAAKTKQRYKSRISRLKKYKKLFSTPLSEGEDPLLCKLEVSERDRVKELEVEVEEQAELIKDLQSGEICAKDGLQYSHVIRECCSEKSLTAP